MTLTDAPQVLARRFCPITQTWTAPGLTPIPAEVMEPILSPHATLADLFCVLGQRDRIATPKSNT